MSYIASLVSYWLDIPLIHATPKIIVVGSDVSVSYLTPIPTKGREKFMAIYANDPIEAHVIALSIPGDEMIDYYFILTDYRLKHHIKTEILEQSPLFSNNHPSKSTKR